jgi:hypothetical protein
MRGLKDPNGSNDKYSTIFFHNTIYFKICALGFFYSDLPGRFSISILRSLFLLVRLCFISLVLLYAYVFHVFTLLSLIPHSV